MQRTTPSKLIDGLQIQNVTGFTAQTCLFIPAKRIGIGKVQIKINGSVHELQAITDDITPIATGTLVMVIGVVSDNILIVTAKL